jgi:hypothetical protein
MEEARSEATLLLEIKRTSNALPLSTEHVQAFKQRVDTLAAAMDTLTSPAALSQTTYGFDRLSKIHALEVLEPLGKLQSALATCLQRTDEPGSLERNYKNYVKPASDQLVLPLSKFLAATTPDETR